MAPIRADELLQNGNFSSGNSHWDGDGEKVAVSDPNNNNSTDALTASPPAGLVVRLKASEWTQITQDFASPPGHVWLIVDYTTTSDFQLSDEGRDFENLPASIGATFWDSFQTRVAHWVAMIGDFGAKRENYKDISPPTNLAGPQTDKEEMNVESNGKKTLYLAFPPGKGAITLQKVSLVSEKTEF